MSKRQRIVHHLAGLALAMGMSMIGITVPAMGADLYVSYATIMTDLSFEEVWNYNAQGYKSPWYPIKSINVPLYSEYNLIVGDKDGQYVENADMNSKEFTWKAADSNIVQFNDPNYPGWFSAVGLGTTTVTAVSRSGLGSVSIPVTVTKADIDWTDIINISEEITEDNACSFVPQVQHSHMEAVGADGRRVEGTYCFESGTKTLVDGVDYTYEITSESDGNGEKDYFVILTGKGKYTGTKKEKLNVPKPVKVEEKDAADTNNDISVTYKETVVHSETMKTPGYSDENLNSQYADTKLAKVKTVKAKVLKKKKAKISWVPVKRAAYYRVQYSMDKKFRKGVKNKTVFGTSVKLTKLKVGKRYFVRVKACYGDQTGAWSNKKSFRAKK